MTDQKEIQEIVNEVKEKVEMERRMYDYLERAGAIKILWLLLKTFFKNKFKLEPIFLDDEEFGVEVGLIATVDLNKFKQRQTTKAF